MLIRLKTVNKKQLFSIFILAPDKHIKRLKVDKIINNNARPSKALAILIESIGNL